MEEKETTLKPRLLEPRSTAAIVFGAHDWTDAGLHRTPSYFRSAKAIIGYLIDSAYLGLDPALVLDLFDDPTPAGEQLARIRDTLDIRLRERREEGRPVADVLIYYIGHGHTDDQGHLSLLVQRSRRGMEVETGIKAPDLARVLKIAAPQQRRLVVLDCCFSEAAARAFIGMSTLSQSVAAVAAKEFRDDEPKRGSLLLCSSPASEVSMGPPNAEHTLFTGAVLAVLRQGVEGKSSTLSFADLRDAAYDRMVSSFGANAPRPILHQVNAMHGDLTRVPAFLNRVQASPPSTPVIETSLQPSTPALRSRGKRLQDYRATPRLIHVARRGYAPAQVRLAELYSQGVGGLPRDDHEAARLFRLAADQGHAGAQCHLGSFYRQGRGGLPRDDHEAARLFRLAADQGDATAQVILGVFHEEGLGGLPQDDHKAAHFFQLAADRGEPTAQASLGCFYEKGRGGLPQNDHEAARLFRLAANQGGPLGQVHLAIFFRQGRGGLSRDECEAARLFRLAADRGDASGQFHLGWFHHKGLGGVPRDDHEAARLFRLAADRGNALAQARLGEFYERGLGALPCDLEEAIRWYRLAAQAGTASAQEHLARLGRSFRLAADQGDTSAQVRLGEFYEHGLGLPKRDVGEAVRWYQRAAQAGDASAQDHLRRLGRVWKG